MNILITGAGGQLGQALKTRLQNTSCQLFTPSRQEVDWTKKDTTQNYLKGNKPDLIFHCAAYTAVDLAETEQEICHAANVTATRQLADYCAESGTVMVYPSTDYVFDGSGTMPWRTTDIPHPLNIYGTTKAEGERLVQARLNNYFIVRISWLFGGDKSFVASISRKLLAGEKLRVVDDQIGSPTYTEDVAETLARLAMSKRFGIYHVTNAGVCSWYQFAVEIARQLGCNTSQITPISSGEWLTAAKRPQNSRLDGSALQTAGLPPLPHWQDALARYLKKQYKERND